MFNINFNIRVCPIQGCNITLNKKRTKYCSRHHRQINVEHIAPDLPKTITNKIVEYKDYAEIEMYNPDGSLIDIAKIDLEDINKCLLYTWRLNNNGYVVRGSTSFLHIYIIGKSSKDLGLDTDHINHDKLDNRKVNLRLISRSDNLFNRKQKGKGVYFNKPTNKHVAAIKVNGKFIHLGLFETEDEAIVKRQKAEQVYYTNIRQYE